MASCRSGGSASKSPRRGADAGAPDAGATSDAGAGAVVAEEVDVEEDVILRADDFGLLEELHETSEVFWLLGEAGDCEEEVGF